MSSGQAAKYNPPSHLEGSKYTVSPALPTGLVLDASTGVISGTPTATSASTKYTVTQTKPDGTTATIAFTMSVSGTVATPTFSPVAGTYNSDQSISLTTSTTGAAIYYTLDGTDPTASSNQYTAVISIAGHGTTKTIKAIAVKTGMTNSSIASASYTINYDAVAQPTFSPAAGTYTSIQSVTISSTTSSAEIRYTTDGSEPTCSTGTVYSSAVSVTATTTLKAIGCKTGMTASSVASAAYTLNLTVATPTFSPTSGSFSATATNLTISSATTGASIYFTTDGTTPTSSSTLYSTAVHIWALAGKTVKAIAIKSGMSDSAVAALTGIFSYPPLKTGSGAISGYTLVTGEDDRTQGVNRGYTGPTAHATYTTDYTTTDNATGLVWKTCSQGLSGATCSTGTAATLSYPNASADATNGCNALNTANSGNGYAGIKTWRLPSRQELETLLDYSKSNPAIDTIAFPGTVANVYWSSTMYAPTTTDAWGVVFSSGNVSYNSLASNVYVRCVSGQSKEYSSSFTDNNNGTIKDNATGLVWQKCSMGYNNDSSCADDGNTVNNISTWTNAITYCSGLSLASKTWRLPTTNELKTIVDTTNASGATIDTTTFPGTVDNTYWSSTAYAYNTTNAWRVSFINGNVGSVSKTFNNYVRCVSGP